jgi:integrase
MRLTDVTVRALALPEKGQRTYFDDVTPSFGVRVSQGGTRTFVVVYGPERIRKTIGRYPIISLAEARAEAKRILAEHTLGRTRPKTVRFDVALAEYLADLQQRVEQGQNKPRTLKCYKRLINRYFAFGQRQLNELTHEDITRKLPTAPAERNHALAAIKIFLSWAQKPPRRYIPYNPCEGMTSTKRPARKRKLNDAELAAVLRTALENTDTYSRIVALLILTGQRRGEITALQWPWISAGRTITLPDWLTKNKTEHMFPYGEMAAAVIAQISRLNSTDYLFPAGRDHVRGIPTTTFNSWSKSKTEFDAKCGVTGWRLHDLRRVFATRLAELRVMPHVIERLLNHKLGSIANRTDNFISAVAEVYNQATYLAETREAIEKWEAHLVALLKIHEKSAEALAA